MGSRAFGAFVSLAAAIAFGVAIAIPAWWLGPPDVNGKVLEAKYVEIGLLQARGCNTGGEGACEDLARDAMLELAGYVETAALALAGLFALLVMIAALRISHRRKGIAASSVVAPRARPGQSGATATTFLPFGPRSSVTRIRKTLSCATLSPRPHCARLARSRSAYTA